jgi:hypothetical protein
MIISDEQTAQEVLQYQCDKYFSCFYELTLEEEKYLNQIYKNVVGKYI